jgi:lipid-binding SYLF domain-containing protein
MEDKKRRRVNVGMMVFAVLAMAAFFASSTTAIAADRDRLQGMVEKARITLNDFMRDPIYAWLHDNIKHAEGVLIFPQVIKGGFIFGGSGGTGVFLARDKETGDWSEPAFYTIGSVTFGLQIGGESAEVIMLAMTPKAVDSLLSSSFKLGGDASVALGPIGGGAKAQADLPSVTADFLTFVKGKGLYAGLNLEGAVIAVRDGMNAAYCGRDVKPTDIVVKNGCSNRGADQLREALRKAA